MLTVSGPGGFQGYSKLLTWDLILQEHFLSADERIMIHIPIPNQTILAARFDRRRSNNLVDDPNKYASKVPAPAEDAGFTLIELMVVLLILAILLAIAIPTFLGVTKSANDRAAQSNLNTAFLNAKAAYQSGGQTYTGVTAASLTSAEPSLSFTTSYSSSQGVISVFSAADGNAIVMAALSKGNCWYQVDNPGGNETATGPFVAGPSATMNGTALVTGTATTAAAGLLKFPAGRAGTLYLEVKGDTATADCNAQTPTVGSSASLVEVSTTGFPAL